MSELKACPFCGQVAYKDFNEVRHLNSQCPAWGFASLETWNTRPVEDALTAKIAELEIDDDETSTDNNKCAWVQDSDPEVFPNLWRAGCGYSFWLDADKPSDNHMKYCCYCGKEIAEGE